MSTLAFVFFCDRLGEYQRDLTLLFQKRSTMKFCHVPWVFILVTVLFVEVHGGKSSFVIRVKIANSDTELAVSYGRVSLVDTGQFILLFTLSRDIYWHNQHVKLANIAHQKSSKSRTVICCKPTFTT